MVITMRVVPIRKHNLRRVVMGPSVVMASMYTDDDPTVTGASEGRAALLKLAQTVHCQEDPEVVGRYRPPSLPPSLTSTSPLRPRPLPYAPRRRYQPCNGVGCHDDDQSSLMDRS